MIRVSTQTVNAGVVLLPDHLRHEARLRIQKRLYCRVACRVLPIHKLNGPSKPKVNEAMRPVIGDRVKVRHVVRLGDWWRRGLLEYVATVRERLGREARH